jgi:hypothetical protein
MTAPLPLREVSLVRTGLLFVTLACASCKPDGSAPTESVVAPEPGAVANAPAGASASVPGAAATPAVLAKPRPHRELLALVDFSKFPKTPGATREDTSPTSANFSVPKKDTSVVTRATQAMDQFLASQGWKPSPGAGDEPWSAAGGARFFGKDGAHIHAVAGISRGYPDGEDLNAGMFLLGEVDVRRLPQPPGSKVERGDFSSVRYTSPMDLLSVRKFFEAQLKPLGWETYRLHTPPGYEVPMERLEKEQSFVQNGVTLSYRLERTGAETIVAVNCGVQKQALPIPPQPDLLKLQDSPALMSCITKMPAAQVLAWCQDALGKDGWTSSPLAPAEENTTRHQFQKAGSTPLILEYLPSGNDTVVQLKGSAP